MKASDYLNQNQQSSKSKAEEERDSIYATLQKSPHDFSKSNEMRLDFTPFNLTELNKRLNEDGWRVIKKDYTEDYRSWSRYFLTIIQFRTT